MKFLVFCFFALSTQFKTYAQDSVDGVFAFKTWLFIEHINQKNHFKSFCKDSNFFNLFHSVIKLRIDTLKANGITNDFVFLQVAPYIDNVAVNDSAIIYSKTKHLSVLSIPINNCFGYVLCINKVTGKSYRLSGFDNNDFVSFIKDSKEQYEFKNGIKLKILKYTRLISVTNLDFECMYKGLTNKKLYDESVYPCLKKCTDLALKY